MRSVLRGKLLVCSSLRLCREARALLRGHLLYTLVYKMIARNADQSPGDASVASREIPSEEYWNSDLQNSCGEGN